jgi:hypothetical protein
MSFKFSKDVVPMIGAEMAFLDKIQAMATWAIEIFRDAAIFCTLPRSRFSKQT